MLASLASLALPDRERQQWKGRLEQFTTTLNFAQEEALSRGTSIWVAVDSKGWRFYRIDRFENVQALTQPEAFAPTAWEVPLQTSPTQIMLGDEAYPDPLVLNFRFDTRTADISRDRFGHFRLELK